MFKRSYTPMNPHLYLARNLLFVEVIGYVTVAFASSELGMLRVAHAAYFAGWLFNLAPAYQLAKAARTMGKSAFLYGILSLLPPGALFSYSRLRTAEIWR